MFCDLLKFTIEFISVEIAFLWAVVGELLFFFFLFFFLGEQGSAYENSQVR